MRRTCLLSHDQPRAPAAHTAARQRLRSADEHLGQRYVQYVNRSYRRSGTLWEGRFRSCLIDSEPYLLACQRYIELNPVRAVMMRHPRQYRWSSYRANAEGKSGDLVTPHDQYLRLGRSAEARREAYRELFHAAPDEV